MNIKFIVNPEKLRNHVKTPHKPLELVDSLARETHEKELWKASKELEALLVSIGFASNRATSIDGDYDFYMNDDVGEFKMLSFEILNPLMATKSNLLKIADWLHNYDSDYSVFITNDYDESLELFMLVVIRNEIFGEFESSTTAEELGFDPKSALIGPIS